jgi:hypothetical protein
VAHEKTKEPQQESFDKIVKKITEAIKSVKYGSVNIIVQDGHVIQIEKLEKERFK